MSNTGTHEGRVVRIAGPVVGVVGLGGIRLFDVVRVGHLGLVGEVIRLEGELATVQVYEDTSGLRTGEPVSSTAQPLVARLGPGLIGQVYDGLQRPLAGLAALSGNFLSRGQETAPLSSQKRWPFTPLVKTGDRVAPGYVIGTVPEGHAIQHRITVPEGVYGRISEIRSGEFTVDQTVAVVELEAGDRARPGDGRNLTLTQDWPVRRPRPVQTLLDPQEPLITGTRIIDTFFPVAKGGSAIIPGGFGTGKTVTEQSLARWADVDVVVYVGCGERGNEMTDVLEEFPKLEDYRRGGTLMERTVLIANTSNMPVAAREASIYTGITIAEYYRDMGYDVLLLADSTSRWGEALREISGRLEELPGEEGYPAYLATRLAEFYERSGRAVCLGSRESEARTGSVTIVGAVSPPGGDFSEPITQGSMRVAGTFWALDYDLSRRRHFPAINWTQSYSLYDLRTWYERNVMAEWGHAIREALALLQRETELLEIVRLVGPDTLSDSDRALLFVTRMLREDFLQQSSAHTIDRFCPVEKTCRMLTAILEFHHQTAAALAGGLSLAQITRLPVVADIARMKEIPVGEATGQIEALIERLRLQFDGMRQGERR
jgi:V/A-type H+-transporting ATPase subunit A